MKPTNVGVGIALALLVLVGVAAVALFVDAFDTGEGGWDLPTGHSGVLAGQDHGFAAYLHAIEHHLTVDVPDGALRDRLERLAAGHQEEERNGNRADPAAGVEPALKRHGNEAPADRLGPEPLRVAEHNLPPRWQLKIGPAGSTA